MTKLGYALLIAVSAAALAGCGGGDGDSPPAAGASQSPTTTPTGAANSTPTISGSAPAAVTAQTAYNFAPTATDADGDTLAFTIQNKPAWATFNTATGRLSGTPSAAHIGSYANVTISVSDGKASSALSAFSIAVNAIGSSNGSATLSWTAPTENTDGSTLANLAGYRISYGTNASALTNSIVIGNPSVTTYVVENLSAATWYFAVTALTSSGTESDLSNVANKTI
jgi:hypothetical protein